MWEVISLVTFPGLRIILIWVTFPISAFQTRDGKHPIWRIALNLVVKKTIPFLESFLSTLPVMRSNLEPF